MIDQDREEHSPERVTPVSEQAPPAPQLQVVKRSGGYSDEGRIAPRRKGPIVNRRGPNEVDRALQMMERLNQQSVRPVNRKSASSLSPRGTVVRLDKAKGYGFLLDSAGEQRFFHRSAVLEGGFDALKEQQAVDFEAHNDERGARALNVRPAGGPAREARPAQPAKASPKNAKTTGWKSDLSPFRNGPPTSKTKRYKV